MGGRVLRAVSGPRATLVFPMNSSTPWLQCFTPRPDARARLICFPHAGVGAAVYRPWSAGLPAALEVVAVQLPGRANRLDEAPVASLDALVQALLPQLLPELDRPFAFFGHSMGAVLASEVARALQAAGLPQPRQLVVSGRRPPHWPSQEAPLHRLPDARFVDEIQRRYGGGIPPELLAHADVMALLLPSLRADIAALETHAPAPGRPPLACALAAFGGSDDPVAPRAHLEGWRGETSGPFRVRVFPGGHFYLNERRDALLADLSVTLAPLLATDPALA